MKHSPAATAALERLGALVGSDRLHSDTEACARFRVDALSPAAVVEPADVRELAEIIHWARTHRAALLPVTSGAYLPLGNPPRALDVAVSLARLHRVLQYDPGDLTLSVEAGIPLADLQRLLAQHNQFLPADPPYAERACLGGLLAANVTGPLRYAYGTWRDFVVGLRFVTGEGKPVKAGGRVVKNVAGYDLTKLLIGSLGTLGVLTEINVRVFPRPPQTATFVFSFSEATAAFQTAMRIVHSAWQPHAIEVLDPEAAKRLPAGGLPTTHWSVVVSVGGVDNVIRRYQADFGALARERQAASFSVLRNEDEQALWSAVRNLLARVREANPRATIVKGALPLAHLEPFIARARQVATRYELPCAASAHAGSGIAYVYLLPPPEMRDAPGRMAQAATEMIHAGNNLAGRVTIPWCPTEVKHNVNVWGPLRDDFPLMQKLKAQFDPDRILSPGRFLGAL